MGNLSRTVKRERTPTPRPSRKGVRKAGGKEAVPMTFSDKNTSVSGFYKVGHGITEWGNINGVIYDTPIRSIISPEVYDERVV